MKWWMTLMGWGVLSVCSCASGPEALRSASHVADLSTIDRSVLVTRENAADILARFRIDFDIPNPLYGERSGASLVYDPSHQAEISCSAVLLDDYTITADILARCVADSLDEAACVAYREKYLRDQVRDGMFRVRLSMESGFSELSMEPRYWAIYLETADGVMIEPADIVVTEVAARTDSVYSEYYNLYAVRRLASRDFTLYFKTTTFYGADLLAPSNPFLVLVMTQEHRMVARVAWQSFAIPGRKE